jgi:hypothetical protein
MLNIMFSESFVLEQRDASTITQRIVSSGVVTPPAPPQVERKTSVGPLESKTNSSPSTPQTRQPSSKFALNLPTLPEES